MAALQLAAEEDVGGDVEVVGQREVLVDRLDPVAAGVDRAGEADGLAVQADLALVGGVDAGDALDQRRLAGAVVAEEAHHLAGVDVEAERADGGEAAEALGDVADGEDRLGHVGGPWRARPTMRSRDWSMSTAMMTTAPTTMNCQKASTFSITRPVVSTAMISEPITVPVIDAGAAEEADAADDDRGDRGEEQRVADDGGAGGEAQGGEEARDAGGDGGEHVERDDAAVDRDARAARRLEVAADGVGVAAELGLAQQEHGDGDDDGGDDHRIGQDAVHAAEELARDLGRRQPVEAAALAADEVGERLVAVGADAGGQADDGGVLGHEQRHAAHDEGRAEGDDEGGDLELGDDDAVEEADDGGGGDGGGEADDGGGEERHAGVEGPADGERGGDRAEAHHPADGEVDAGADDDEGLAEPEEQDRGDGDEDVLRVADGEEADRAAGGERHRDDEEERPGGRGRPRPRGC